MHKKLSDLVIQDYITAKESDVVGDIKEKWRKLVLPSRIGHIIYVVDDKGDLVGLVDLREIFAEKLETPVRKIMKTEVYSINKGANISEAVRIVIRKRISEIPVVHKNKLVGMVLSEDLLNSVNWDNKRTFYKMAGILDGDGDKTTTLKTILNGVENRSLWLIISAVLGVFLAGGIINKYESALMLIPAIAVFIPVLMGTGGNMGAQTSTIFVRILSANEPEDMRRLSKLFLSDFVISVLLGIILGAVVGGSAYVMFGDAKLSITLAISMLAISVCAVVIGFIIPFVSFKLKIDPALTSGPLVTTIKDVVALLIYFAIIYSFYL